MDTKNRSVWMRVGTTLNMTEQEYETIMMEKPESEDLLREILKRGDFEFNGDCYIPASEVELCNEAYGSYYKPCDISFDI